MRLRNTRVRGSHLRRQIDHAVGSPLLFAAGLARRKRDIPKSITSIGILSCSAIGDTIVASAIARDLKVAFPGCRIVAFIAPSTEGISSLVEGFDQEVIVPITQPLQAIQIVRRYPTDVVIDVCPWQRMIALVARFAKTSFTVGFRTPGQHHHFAYDATVPHSEKRHEVDNLRALLRPIGIVGKLLPRARAEVSDMAHHGAATAQVVILHPWASGFRSEMREWPMIRWVELAHLLISDGATILITGGPSDRQRAETLSTMIDRPGNVDVVAGYISLSETALCLAKVDLIVSVNTGIMHLAAALDKKLVALHGPTNPLRWGPLSSRAVIVGPGRDRGGAYLNLGFEYPDGVPDCMPLISVSEVIAQAQGLIVDTEEASPSYSPD